MSIENKNLRSRPIIYVNHTRKQTSYVKRNQSFFENTVLNEESISIPISEEDREKITEELIDKLYDEELGDFKGVEQDEIISAYEQGCLVFGMTVEDLIEYVNRPDLSEDF